MISKIARQGIILEIVRKSGVKSQDELSFRLKSRGIDVTQSTLSRDIRDLGLIKVRGCYMVSGESSPTPSANALRRAFTQSVVQTGVSGNIVMVKTSPGNAHSIGVILDAAQWPEVLGTVAGDDTVFVLLRSDRFGKKVLSRMQELST
jgi:transcriptional regulator of arginine metabolism